MLMVSDVNLLRKICIEVRNVAVVYIIRASNACMHCTRLVTGSSHAFFVS